MHLVGVEKYYARSGSCRDSGVHTPLRMSRLIWETHPHPISAQVFAFPWEGEEGNRDLLFPLSRMYSVQSAVELGVMKFMLQALHALWDALPCLLDVYERAPLEADVPPDADGPPGMGVPFTQEYLRIVVDEAEAALRAADYPVEGARHGDKPRISTFGRKEQSAGQAAIVLGADIFLRYMQLPQGPCRDTLARAADACTPEQLLDAGPEVLRYVSKMGLLSSSISLCVCLSLSLSFSISLRV